MALGKGCDESHPPAWHGHRAGRLVDPEGVVPGTVTQMFVGLEQSSDLMERGLCTCR